MSLPELGPDERVAESLEREHMRPFWKFKGRELWPFTQGSKLMWRHVLKDDITPELKGLSFVFIHLKRTESKFKDDARRHLHFVWNILDFRAELLEWVASEKLTDADTQEAIKIAAENIQADEDTKVTVQDTRSDEEKIREAGKKKEPDITQEPVALLPSS